MEPKELVGESSQSQGYIRDFVLKFSCSFYRDTALGSLSNIVAVIFMMVIRVHVYSMSPCAFISRLCMPMLSQALPIFRFSSHSLTGQGCSILETRPFLPSARSARPAWIRATGCLLGMLLGYALWQSEQHKQALFIHGCTYSSWFGPHHYFFRLFSPIPGLHVFLGIGTLFLQERKDC